LPVPEWDKISPMKILVIIGNPNLGSFSHAIGDVVKIALNSNGHEVLSHDLYAEGFDPRLPAGELVKDAVLDPVIRRHCGEAVSVDGIVIIHPNWWGQPPAILKGWVDRVLRQGVAYSFQTNDAGEGVPMGLLKAKSAAVFTTSNTPDEREKVVFGDPLENLWKKCIFDFCGVTNFRRRNFSVMVASNTEQRKAWLEEARGIVLKMFPAKG